MKMLQIPLTTSESKKLISDALFHLDCVKKALNNGILVIHPSSTVYFLYENICGCLPEDGWVFGLVTKDGLCRSQFVVNQLSSDKPSRKVWIFKKGVLADPMSLDAILSEMGPEDVFIKGCNAIDSDGNIAVLSSAPEKGGTTGKVLKAKAERGFELVVPVGAEKSVPNRISDLLEFCGKNKADCGGGLACGIFPINGARTITEVQAIRELFGIEAIVGAGGGICGAEGGTIIYAKAEDDKCQEVLDYFASIKGVKIPDTEYVSYN